MSLQHSPDVSNPNSRIVVGCVLLNPEGKAVEFARCALNLDLDSDDRELLEETLGDIEEAQANGQLSSMWDEAIRHWSNFITCSVPEPTGAVDMSAATKEFHLTLAPQSNQARSKAHSD